MSNLNQIRPLCPALTAILFFLAFNQFTYAEITFDLMHTVQQCQHESRKPTYCDGKTDTKKMTELSGMVDKINAQLDRALIKPKESSVFLAYFSFSNKYVHTKLCELIQKGVRVEVVLDAGSSQNISDILNNPACDGAAQKNNFKYSYLGGLTSTPWRLHHNKFLYVDPANGENLNINFSSGNLSSFGTSLHLDHWVTMTAPSDSNLVKSYKCVMTGLRAAIARTEKENGHNSDNDYAIAQTYIASRENCFKSNSVVTNVEDAIKKEKIASLYAPNNENEVYNAFSRQIRYVTAQASATKTPYIYIAIQHFLDYKIGQDLERASKAGVDVRIIMDNDVVNNEGEVQGAKDFLDNLKARAPRIQVRYIETNSNAGGNGQMMHNKFAILNGVRIFSGAGQYTGAAMRKNWENFAITEVPSLTKKYALYFKEMWDVSVDEKYVNNQPGSTQPAKLNDDFLKLITDNIKND